MRNDASHAQENRRMAWTLGLVIAALYALAVIGVIVLN